MKHYRELSEAEREEFADKLGDDLSKFFVELRTKYNMCDNCLHNAVILMCEGYVANHRRCLAMHSTENNLDDINLDEVFKDAQEVLDAMPTQEKVKTLSTLAHEQLTLEQEIAKEEAALEEKKKQNSATKDS